MPRPDSFYVTGTDTGIGKTCVSVALLRSLRASGKRVAGMKPIASGCELTPEGLRNEDALALLEASELDLPYDWVNPEAFREPVSPHAAAAWSGREIDIERIVRAYQALRDTAEAVIVEGVGGWMAPLGEHLDQAAICRRLNLPVVMVVGLRLGCLNHAGLTLRAIEADGVAWAGWAVSEIDPGMLARNENLDWLSRHLPPPFLGLLPWQGTRLRPTPD